MKIYEIDVVEVLSKYRKESGFEETLGHLRAFLNSPNEIFLACIHEAGHLLIAQKFDMISPTFTTSTSPKVTRNQAGEFSYEIAFIKSGYLDNNPTITEQTLIEMARIGVAGGVFAAVIAKKWSTVVEWDLISEANRKKLGYRDRPRFHRLPRRGD